MLVALPPCSDVSVRAQGDAMESWDVFIVKVLQRILAQREEAIEEGRDSAPYDEILDIFKEEFDWRNRVHLKLLFEGHFNMHC
jgi:hypothetical protein